MVEAKALALVFERSDKGFFIDHPDRKAHIRNAYKGEAHGEFWTLGTHDIERRRILLCRTDSDGNFLDKDQILKIPFLAFADETIEDTDAVLLPIIKQIMAEAFQREKRR